MKRIITAILIATLVLSACATNPNTENPSPSPVSPNVKYSEMLADYRVFSDAPELVSSADLVVIGKVTNMSFQMLDMVTGLPPTEQSEDTHIELNTIYAIDVITVYKGEVSGTFKIRNQGGQKDVRVAEQLALLGQSADKGIPIEATGPKIEIGETYLFSLRVFEGTDPCVKNPEQSVLNLRDPAAKDKYEKFSARDIVAEFGDEKLAAFDAAWVK